jgi:hypothetical protein
VHFASLDPSLALRVTAAAKFQFGGRIKLPHYIPNTAPITSGKTEDDFLSYPHRASKTIVPQMQQLNYLFCMVIDIYAGICIRQASTSVFSSEKRCRVVKNATSRRFDRGNMNYLEQKGEKNGASAARKLIHSVQNLREVEFLTRIPKRMGNPLQCPAS